ncbi:hypothetical protein HRbin15_02198 [bacterium HR15]|nr:hypothetical protein HRbin15_02198 [bacterium HR15]
MMLTKDFGRDYSLDQRPITFPDYASIDAAAEAEGSCPVRCQ